MDTFKQEIKNGERFEFGKNWQSFLSTLTEEKIKIAENSITEMLGFDNLEGKRVVDIGSGSGLFSLAARRLGADVQSFDFDPESVNCTKNLCLHYYPNDNRWRVERGSVLDNNYLNKLGRFDIVYSWGVLHHTGDMWRALENIIPLVKQKGSLFISIYNDQSWLSKFWWNIKKFYCSSFIGKVVVSSIYIPAFFLVTFVESIIRRENLFSKYKVKRGMSITHDWFDWLGGYPFETAKVEDIVYFYKNKGFVLEKITTTNGSGVNQFVFSRV